MGNKTNLYMSYALALNVLASNVTLSMRCWKLANQNCNNNRKRKQLRMSAQDDIYLTIFDKNE